MSRLFTFNSTLTECTAEPVYQPTVGEETSLIWIFCIILESWNIKIIKKIISYLNKFQRKF